MNWRHHHGNISNEVFVKSWLTLFFVALSTSIGTAYFVVLLFVFRMNCSNSSCSLYSICYSYLIGGTEHHWSVPPASKASFLSVEIMLPSALSAVRWPQNVFNHKWFSVHHGVFHVFSVLHYISSDLHGHGVCLDCLTNIALWWRKFWILSYI